MPIVLLTAAAGLVRTFRLRKDRPWLQLAAFLGLAVMSWEPFSWLFSAPLEAPYTRRTDLNGGQAIVILAGAVDRPGRYHPYPVLGKDSLQRCLEAAWLYRSGLRVPMLATGRDIAGPMADFLASQGVPRQAIWIEDGSRNTHENAVFSTRILRVHRIQDVVLVTEAKAMLRAKRCFEKLGVAVIPSPTNYTTVETLLPNSRAIVENSNTLHEFGGLVYYWMRGWI